MAINKLAEINQSIAHLTINLTIRITRNKRNQNLMISLTV